MVVKFASAQTRLDSDIRAEGVGTGKKQRNLLLVRRRAANIRGRDFFREFNSEGKYEVYVMVVCMVATDILVKQ